jgi:hypothetical protein
MAGLPSFIVAYDQKEIQFWVKSTNAHAEVELKVDDWVLMDEAMFVSFLMYLRNAAK